MLYATKAEVAEINYIALTRAIDSILPWPLEPVHMPGVLKPQSLDSIPEVVISAFMSLGKTCLGFQAFLCTHKSRDDSREAIIELFNRQKSPTADDFLELRSTSTLIIREAYKFLPFANNLRNVWLKRFSCHINTNVYASSPSSDAFPWHKDPHHVFALQLAGTKRWWLSKEHDGDFTRHSDQGAIEITSQIGDILFIPKGVPHRAQAAEMSVHISISVEEKAPLNNN